MMDQGRGDTLRQFEVVTFALAQLGGLERPVHLEQIAVKAYEVLPGSFRWDLDEYAAFVDKDKVRVSLTDAEKPKNGALVEGCGVTKGRQTKRTDLWRLTSAGAGWVLDQTERIRGVLGGPTPQLKRAKASLLRKRLLSSPLYQKFERTGSVPLDPYAFTDLVECSPDAARAVVERRFDELKGQVRLLDEPALSSFLDACEAAHDELLGRKRVL